LAAANGKEEVTTEAGTFLFDLERTMSPARIAKAQRPVREWKPKGE